MYENYKNHGFDGVYWFVKKGVSGGEFIQPMGNLKNWDYTKRFVRFGVMNYELNRGIVEEQKIVSRKMEDLILYCQLILPKAELVDGEQGIATVRISEPMLLVWGISEEELFEQCYVNENYKIIPSSVEEILLLIDNQDYDFNEIKEIVKQVNKETVLPDEFLSNSVYYYDRQKREVMLVA